MGHMLIEAIRASDDCLLAGALDVPASPAIGNAAAARDHRQLPAARSPRALRTA